MERQSDGKGAIWLFLRPTELSLRLCCQHVREKVEDVVETLMDKDGQGLEMEDGGLSK